MILSAHQPAYLPWLGYFEKLTRSDLFVFLDTVQFEKNSFTNRNRIKTPQGILWLTVPVKVKGHTTQTMRETRIDNRQNWRQKHLRTIFLNYKKAPRFEQCYPKLEQLYQKEYDLLIDLCFDHLLFWLNELKISTKVLRSGEIPVEGKKSELIWNLCQYFGADCYLSGLLGRDYLDQHRFHNTGIQIEFQDYRHPTYLQLHGGFVSHLSIIDFWMNTDRAELIIASGQDSGTNAALR